MVSEILREITRGRGCMEEAQPWAVLQLGFLLQVSNICTCRESTGQEKDSKWCRALCNLQKQPRLTLKVQLQMQWEEDVEGGG